MRIRLFRDDRSGPARLSSVPRADVAPRAPVQAGDRADDGLVVAAILRVFPWGAHLSADDRDATAEVLRQAHRTCADAGPRSTKAGRVSAGLGIESTRTRVEQYYAESEPELQRSWMRYAGMDPEHGLLRWANYDWTLLLSSKVFEADETGRSYTFRPLTRSIWLRNVPASGRRGELLPRARRAGAGRGASAAPGRSRWRRRGRRPTPGACAGPSRTPTPPSAGWSWAIPSCRGCSSATTRRRRNACAATSRGRGRRGCRS